MYRLTTQKAVRQEFWATHPYLSRKKVRDWERQFTSQWCCDTRCAFVDFVDYLSKDGSISQSLADKVTL